MSTSGKIVDGEGREREKREKREKERDLQDYGNILAFQGSDFLGIEAWDL